MLLFLAPPGSPDESQHDHSGQGSQPIGENVFPTRRTTRREHLVPFVAHPIHGRCYPALPVHSGGRWEGNTAGKTEGAKKGQDQVGNIVAPQVRDNTFTRETALAGQEENQTGPNQGRQPVE